MTARLLALFRKEMLELGRNPAALVPVGLVAIVSLLLPVFIVSGLPMITGHPFGESAELVRASAVLGDSGLDGTARVQLFMAHQFLVLFLLTPISGAMAIAAYAVVGEKQARTLEALLATPVATWELLVAKVLGALAPTLALSGVALAGYFGWIAATAEPGVFAAMLTARTALLVLAVGPLAALVALQIAVVVSSRVNDPRTAQQFGVLLIIPLTAVLVAQFTGLVWVSAALLAWAAVGLLGTWALLVLLSVAVFEREHILTRWR